MFRHIKLLTLRAAFSPQREGRLPPYLGSTLRGLIGHSIRDFICDAPARFCHNCEKKRACCYAKCFCSPGNAGGAVNPFVLYPPPAGKSVWRPGDLCAFDLTLIGGVVQYAGVFLDALQAVEKRGWGAERIPFRLEYAIDPLENRLLIGGGQTWMRNIKARELIAGQRPAKTVLVRFDTPARVLESKRLCRDLSFAQLIRSLSRRIALLSQAYTDRIVEWDEDAMLSAAERVKTVRQFWRYLDFKRYSMNHADHTLSLPAIDGWALYEGDIAPFVPLLEAGRVLHAGKNATIGFGHFDAAYDS